MAVIRNIIAKKIAINSITGLYFLERSYIAFTSNGMMVKKGESPVRLAKVNVIGL